MSRRQKPERRILGDLAIQHRDELVQTRRVIEACVQILEQTLGDVPIHVEFVDAPQQERLMHHCREKTVCRMVTRNIQNSDACLLLAPFQMISRITLDSASLMSRFMSRLVAGRTARRNLLRSSTKLFGSSAFHRFFLPLLTALRIHRERVALPDPLKLFVPP